MCFVETLNGTTLSGTQNPRRATAFTLEEANGLMRIHEERANNIQFSIMSQDEHDIYLVMNG